MNAKLNQIACKAIGCAGCVFLTLFAVIFAGSCIAIFIMGLYGKDFIALIISAMCGFWAWACWSIRKDTLV